MKIVFEIDFKPCFWYTRTLNCHRARKYRWLPCYLYRGDTTPQDSFFFFWGGGGLWNRGEDFAAHRKRLEIGGKSTEAGTGDGISSLETVANVVGRLMGGKLPVSLSQSKLSLLSSREQKFMLRRPNRPRRYFLCLSNAVFPNLGGEWWVEGMRGVRSLKNYKGVVEQK